MPLLNNFDRRRKLTAEQREAVKQRFLETNFTAEVIAKEFNVSKTTVLCIINPDYAAKRKAYNKSNCSKYYDHRTPEQRAKIAKESAMRKKELIAKGLI